MNATAAVQPAVEPEAAADGSPADLPPTVTLDALLDREGGRATDRRFRQMLYDLLYLESRMREARDRLGGAIGLTGPGYTVLMTVAQYRDSSAPGAGVRVRDVADRLHVSGAFVTAEVNRLVARGLVSKRPDPADGRAVRLVVTAAGHREICTLLPRIRAVNDHFFRGLSQAEFLTLSSLAARLGGQAATDLSAIMQADDRRP